MASELLDISLLQRDAPPMMAAVPPPPGVTQDFVNPPVTAEAAPVLVGVGVAIAGFLVLVRMYTKGFLLRKFGAEDGTLSYTHVVLLVEGEYGTTDY